MNRVWPFISVLLLTGLATAQQSDFPNIKNFLRHDENFCTGGQPPMEDLAKMKEQGLKSVLNLRRDLEYDAAEEEAALKKLGLKYFRVPVDGSNPKDEQADEILKILADPANRPMFFHCTTANRVGAFWMIRRVLVDGWSAKKAEEDARKVGLHSENLKKFAVDYITRHQKK
ncbi:MAG: hypothetical protein HY046_00200 [Acidobacteria bacterium]|nr:hypothetical protein [Acidobacteriota bacterium]